MLEMISFHLKTVGLSENVPNKHVGLKEREKLAGSFHPMA
jgi:hypothetical protein